MIRQIKRLFRDFFGVALIRGWIRIADDSVTHIKMDDVKDILRLYSKTFKGMQTGQITKYTSMFQDISYIIRESEKTVGYCLYYLKPEIRLNGLRKIAVIYSIAVDEEFRKRNIGERLLLHSIKEMRLNKIDYIRLYVDEYNTSALNLYSKLGFRIIGKLKNICGYGYNCYEMQLELDACEDKYAIELEIITSAL